MDVARPGNNGPGAGWLAAAVLATWVRKPLARRAESASGAVACGLSALAAAAFPLLVLGAGWLALALPDGLDAPWADAWTKDHRDAWALFWTAMLAFNVGEVLALRILAASGRFQMPALLRGVVRGVVAVGAALIVLRAELGWNITPLLASTALVTAVVGFALQGVLGNLLAGMSLNLTGSLSHRDWVMVDDLEGQVDEMNWRETWIVTHENIPVRLPNSKVADARIRNLSRPEGPRRCSLYVDASYDDPPDAVIDAMLAAAAAVPDVRRTPPPTAFVLDYKSYGVGYELRFWLDRYPLREPIQGEVRRHIWYQFRRSGIQIPYPVTDQVLDDFMRRAVPPAPPPPENPDGKRQADALLQSEFARRVLCSEEDRPLVPEPELRAWAERLSTVLYGTGEYVFRQGDGGDCCFVVLTGALSGRVRHGDSGKETTFNVGAGEVVGEMSLLTGRPRPADVRVERSAELLRIPAAGFAALLAGRPGLAEQLSRLVAERVQHNLRQVEQQLAEDAASGEPAVSSEGILRRFWRLLGGAPE